MVKKEWIRDILENILKSKETVGEYTRKDIEKAIILSRGMDKRTISNWFDTLWALEYFTQPKKGVYCLDFAKVAELDLKIPERAHTQTLLPSKGG